MSDKNSLIDFIEKNKKDIAIMPQSTQKDMLDEIIKSLPFGSLLTKDKVQDFTSNVSKLIQSKPFLQEISDKISQPRAGETEEEFVARGTAVIKEVLRSKFEK